jgi:hypothetical protein
LRLMVGRHGLLGVDWRTGAQNTSA